VAWLTGIQGMVDWPDAPKVCTACSFFGRGRSGERMDLELSSPAMAWVHWVLHARGTPIELKAAQEAANDNANHGLPT
jgi:hypothetical protein